MASSFSSKSPLLFRKKAPIDQTDDASHLEHLQIEKPSFSYKSNSSSFQDHDFVDLTEMSLHSPEHGNALPGGMSGSGPFGCSRKSALTNGASSTDLLKSTMRSSASEGTENTTEVISSKGYGQRSEFVDDGHHKPGDDGSLRHEPIVSPRVNKQKRLVRNGYISPNNIAKVKQLAGKINNGFAHDNDDAITSGDPLVPGIRELVSESRNSHNRKGKGLIMYPCTSKDPEIKTKNLPSRSSSCFIGKAKETSDQVRGTGQHIEESGEWRSTHTCQELWSSSTGEEQFIKREIDVPKYANQHNEKRTAKREKGSGVAPADNDSKVPNLVSPDNVSSLPLRQTMSLPRARLGPLNMYPSSGNTFIKRQKHETTSSYSSECSTSVSDDSEVVILSSCSGESNSRSMSGDVANLHQTIDVDDFKPNIHDEVAMAKQVEADELLARELQEQLYNDLPVLGVDTHTATVLHRQDNSNNPFSSRGSVMSNFRRESQSRSSSNPSRRGSQARASTLGRMTRLRTRFPGQPRTLLPSRGTSLFPADMDVETRMHILGTLEAFSDMEVGTGNLITRRDFNENDYETLLALDENNDHGGASVHQINGLPQSTVQSDNFDEACVICLETPIIGDTIRHLPCLHKFHKDCIDPWLRRRTLCPVCKSAIT